MPALNPLVIKEAALPRNIRNSHKAADSGSPAEAGVVDVVQTCESVVDFVGWKMSRWTGTPELEEVSGV